MGELRLTWASCAEVLTANLTATGLDKGGRSAPAWTADPTICLGLDAGGHDSIELKILWPERAMRVRPRPRQQ